MNFLDDFIFYGSLISDNRTLKLLRADNAPLIMAFLKNIFQEESEVDYIEARERLTEFLSELQKQYPDENRSSATVYFREWIANGWIREMNNRLTMSDAAQKAINMCTVLNSRIVSTSATHLQILQTEIQKLYIQVSSDKKERIKELRLKKKEIEEEIELIRAGKDMDLSPEEQRERIRAIYDIACRLPEDFRRLEEESRDVDKQIRIRISESRYTKGELLQNVLNDERQQRLTDYGAAYEGFMNLLSDKNTTDNFTRQINAILAKPIAGNLTDDQQFFLKNLIDKLNFESSRVIRVRQRIDENLRIYIESASFEENRLLAGLLKKLDKMALHLKDSGVNLNKAELDIYIENSSADVNSVESITIAEPVGLINTENMVIHETGRTLSNDILGMLDTVRMQDVRASFNRTVRALRQQRKDEPVTVADIVSGNTIRYGLQEVVAYIRVANEQKAVITPGIYDEILIDDNRYAGRKLKIRIPRQTVDIS